MPRGGDWVRFCAAIDGFRARYGRWPTRVVMWQGFRDNLHYSIGPDGLRAVEQKLTLLEHPDEQGLAAEDGEGNRYDYAREGFSEQQPDVRAVDWLGIGP